MKVSKYVAIFNNKDIYPQYFQPEIKSFLLSSKNKKENAEKSSSIKRIYQDICERNNLPKKKDDKKKIINFNHNNWIDEMVNNFPEDFEGKRAIGENDDYICELIRKDLIKIKASKFVKFYYQMLILI